jgi:quercetin dioxygenase-like cupin family protein
MIAALLDRRTRWHSFISWVNSTRKARKPGKLSNRRKEAAMEIKRSGSQPSGKGPADYFTGTVRIDPLFEAPEPARARGASVTFEPGARTAWHTHPLGQTLIVTSGFGWVQRWGCPAEEIRPGDVVWFAPGEKHWHGAAPTTAMTHIAIQETVNGKAVDWLEHVSDEQYQTVRLQPAVKKIREVIGGIE